MPLNVCFGWKLVLCNSALESVSLKYILMSNLRVLNVVVSKKLISVGSRVGLSFIEGWWLFGQTTLKSLKVLGRVGPDTPDIIQIQYLR